MKTIQFTGTESQLDNFKFIETLQKTETRVYILSQQDTTRKIEELTDEKFVEIAEQVGSVYTLQGFQDTFNNTKDRDGYSIRFINTPLNN